MKKEVKKKKKKRGLILRGPVYQGRILYSTIRNIKKRREGEEREYFTWGGAPGMAHRHGKERRTEREREREKPGRGGGRLSLSPTQIIDAYREKKTWVALAGK